MPHYPYINVRPPYSIDPNSISSLREFDDKGYYNYIKYTDKLIVNILQSSLRDLTPLQKSNTLIVLQSDHGYRYLKRGTKELKWKSNFGTLNAVLWPSNKKGSFYNGMSSVNTFRILLHDYWGINISTLKDSSVIIYSPVL
jgi:membrane-anchored protein YejM (alkaline phosphatase superfamily)